MAHDDQQQLFEMGASVEVSPDDLGLAGSWYEATILTVPKTPKTERNYKTKRSKKKKKPLYYDVEYKTLLDDEDETKLLTERVRADHIRPLPPPSQQIFELNDVVEAFHRDGWWVGVVTRLPLDSGKYQVTFNYPPDQIECAGSILRIHLQWKGGAWVQPEAQAANQLEIDENLKAKSKRPHEEEQAEDGVCKNGSRGVLETPLLKRSKALESSDLIKMWPSKRRRRHIVASSSNDVNDDPTNWGEDEDSKEACGNVAGEDGIPGSNQKNPTNGTSGTRPQTLSACSVDDSVSQDSVSEERAKEGWRDPVHNKSEKMGVDAGNQNHTERTSDAQLQTVSLHSAPCDDSGRSLNQNVQDVSDIENEPDIMDKETLDRAVALAIAGEGNGSTFVNRNKESELVEQTTVEEECGNQLILLSGEMEIAKEAASVGENGCNVINLGQELEAMEQAAGVDGYGNKCLNPSQETDKVVQVVGVDGNETEILNLLLESEVVDQAVAGGANNDEIVSPVQEMEIAKQAAAVERKENNVVNSDQEMENVEQAAVEGNTSKVITPNHELAIVGKYAAAIDKNGSNFINLNKELENVEGHAAAAVDGNVVDPNDLKLPFGKTLPLWNIIESMQVFQAIPQRPHFRRLVDKYPVHCREGKAIGYMLMFRDVVQKAVKLQLDDERESIVEILGTLPKLEDNGFEVHGMRDHLATLLERRDEHSRIQNQLMELNQKKAEIVEVIEVLNEQIKERQEKCAVAMSTRENIEREIAHIESNLMAVRLSFEKMPLDLND